MWMTIAQIPGLIAMGLNIFSFQQREQKTLIRIQLYSSILFIVHFAMLGAVTGCVLNVISMARAYVFSSKQNAWARHKAWIPVFIVIYLIVYALTFTLFGKEPTWQNLLLEMLPVIGMSAMTVGFALDNAAQVRALSLVNSPAWLVYNILCGSIGGALSEAFSLASVIIGMIRLDRKEPKA